MVSPPQSPLKVRAGAKLNCSTSITGQDFYSALRQDCVSFRLQGGDGRKGGRCHRHLGRRQLQHLQRHRLTPPCRLPRQSLPLAFMVSPSIPIEGQGWRKTQMSWSLSWIKIFLSPFAKTAWASGFKGVMGGKEDDVRVIFRVIENTIRLPGHLLTRKSNYWRESLESLSDRRASLCWRTRKINPWQKWSQTPDELSLCISLTYTHLIPKKKMPKSAVVLKIT